MDNTFRCTGTYPQLRGVGKRWLMLANISDSFSKAQNSASEIHTRLLMGECTRDCQSSSNYRVKHRKSSTNQLQRTVCGQNSGFALLCNIFLRWRSHQIPPSGVCVAVVLQPPSWSWCQRDRTNKQLQPSARAGGTASPRTPCSQKGPLRSGLTRNTAVVMLAMNAPQNTSVSAGIHNKCLHPTLKVKIRWNCCLSIPQDGIWKAQQVQTFMRMGSGLLCWLRNPKQTLQWTTAVLKVQLQTYLHIRVFLPLCCSSTKCRVSSPLPVSFSFSCISGALQFPPAVFQTACSPCMKCSLSISLLLFPLNFLCYLLCLLLFLLCHQKLTPYSLPISLCLSAHSSASWRVMVNGRPWQCYLICSHMSLHTDVPLLMEREAMAQISPRQNFGKQQTQLATNEIEWITKAALAMLQN